jgi:hypothetical protein
MARHERGFSCAVRREIFVGREELAEEPLVGVRSTSWMWRWDRPGKANCARVGDGDNTQRPGLFETCGWGEPFSLSVVSKVCNFTGGLLNR